MTHTPPKLPTLAELFASATASATKAKEDARRRPHGWPTNPFPRGIHPGSTTDRVLTELRRVAPQPLEAGQLRMRCNANRGAVNWATRYLESLGLVECLHDPRSPQYKRYRLRRTGNGHD